MNVVQHAESIGNVLAIEHPSDAVVSLFNLYAELPGREDREAFTLALIGELVVGRERAKLG